MSKRRKVGDIVRKTKNGGFVKVPLDILLIDIDGFPTMSCMLSCDDPECQEWTDAKVIIDGQISKDYVYHISECEMEDL